MADKVRNLEEKREYHREWRKKHPEAIIAAQARYWAKKAAEIRAAQDTKEMED